ncbi:MAG: purine-nucleoside phosphorylase [Bacteroidota bacterium]
MTPIAAIETTAAFIRSRVDDFTPEIGMVLGSGLGIMGEEVDNPVYIPYQNIPGFPVSTVKGHAGRLVLGQLEGRKVIVMQGRFHYYEGHSLATLAFPVRVMRLLGVTKLLVTNAAGATNADFAPGDLMLIRDHLNLVFHNPLMGGNLDTLGPRFPDMSEAYSPRLLQIARQVAQDQAVALREGVYQFMTGPSYETPAEVRMAQSLGADAVGMSTVPEVIAAQHCGIEVVGLSSISNLAAGISEQALSHAEVVEVTSIIKDKFIKLVRGIVGAM